MTERKFKIGDKIKVHQGYWPYFQNVIHEVVDVKGHYVCAQLHPKVTSILSTKHICFWFKENEVMLAAEIGDQLLLFDIFEKS